MSAPVEKRDASTQVCFSSPKGLRSRSLSEDLSPSLKPASDPKARYHQRYQQHYQNWLSAPPLAKDGAKQLLIQFLAQEEEPIDGLSFIELEYQVLLLRLYIAKISSKLDADPIQTIKDWIFGSSVDLVWKELEQFAKNHPKYFERVQRAKIDLEKEIADSFEKTVE